MSFSIDYSALFAGAGAGAGAGSGNGTLSALLNASLGLGGSAPAFSGADAINALGQAERNQTSDIAAVAKQSAVARDIAAFTAGVAKATDASSLLSNPAVLKVLLTASGLASQTAYPALAKKALLSDPAVSTSLANQLANPAWKTTAATYNFATAGLAVISTPAVQATLVQAYAEVTWRQSLDAANPGLSSALSFRANASSFTSTLAILGDPIARDVVTTALGIPQEIAFQPLEAQQKAISDRLDLTQLAKPSFVENLVKEYLINKAAATSGTPGTSLDSLAAQSAGLVV